jgi:hypothetical protein
MNEKMFDALEVCLNELESGGTIDSALRRYPAFASELRPMLEAALHARGMAGEAVPDAVRRRGRARLLQHAAEMRESRRIPRKRTWIFALRPVAVTLMLVVFLLSGTGLVRASSTSLPGDNLYPVKRSWEDVTLLLAVNTQHREGLELEYETERVGEVSELLAKGRTEVVSFSGYIKTQTASEWNVAGVPVLLNTDTVRPTTALNVGDAVTISGTTNELGFLVAQTVQVVAPGTIVPEIDADENENQSDQQGSDHNGSEANSNGGDESEGNSNGGASSSDSSGENGNESHGPSAKLLGVLQSASGTEWIVNGQKVDVSGAEIVGTPAPGAQVTVEGYYTADGTFVATRVIFSTNGNGNDGSSVNGDDHSGGSDDSSNTNDTHDDGGGGGNSNDSSGSDDGGGSNSGSGSNSNGGN